MSKGDVTRAAIIERAASVASVEGLEGLSIGTLASLAGMSKSGLFGHFGSKEALQQAVVERVVEDFTANVVAPSLALPTGLERLETLFTRWLDWCQEDDRSAGCPLLSASFELDDKPGPLRDYLVEKQAAWLDCISRIARRAVKDGDFRADLDTEQLAFEVQGIGMGFSFAWRLMRDPQARARANTAFELLVANARS